MTPCTTYRTGGRGMEVMQTPIHPRTVVDTVAHLCEVFKDDARRLELTAPLHDMTAHPVESVAGKPFFPPFQSIVNTVLLRVLPALPHREVAMALELDFGKVDD
jgi:hypothetical protein